MGDGISWVGLRVDDVEGAAAFFVDALGFNRVKSREDFIVLDAPNGDRVELFGPRGPQPAHQFERNSVMVGFSVGNLDAAREQLVRHGAELLGDGDKTWQHFRGPGDFVYEVNQAKSSS